MEKQRINIETYRYNNDYYIDIVETIDNLEAWLYEKNVGIKDFMFGMPIYQQSYEKFLELVEANAPDYIKLYILEWRE